MVSDSWKKEKSYMASANSQKTLQKSTKNVKLSTIFRGLNDQSYQISEATFHRQFFIILIFFCHKTPEGLETWIN